MKAGVTYERNVEQDSDRFRFSCSCGTGMMISVAGDWVDSSKALFKVRHGGILFATHKIETTDVLSGRVEMIAFEIINEIYKASKSKGIESPCSPEEWFLALCVARDLVDGR